MKRFFCFFLLVLFSISSFAQNTSTLEFLGIPIDGPIEQMYDALKVKGFKQEYLRRYKKPLEGLSYEEMEEALFCLPAEVSDAVIGVVWFTIVNASWININYVNFRNRPRGEDL